MLRNISWVSGYKLLISLSLLLTACDTGSSGPSLPPGTTPPPPAPDIDRDFQEQLRADQAQLKSNVQVTPISIPTSEIKPSSNGTITVSTYTVPSLQDTQSYKTVILNDNNTDPSAYSGIYTTSFAPDPNHPGFSIASLTPATLTDIFMAGDLFFTDYTPFQNASISSNLPGVTVQNGGGSLTVTFNDAVVCGADQSLRLNGTLNLQLVYTTNLRIRQSSAGPRVKVEHQTTWKQSGTITASGACNGGMTNMLAVLDLPVQLPKLGTVPVPLKRQIKLALSTQGNLTGTGSFGATYNGQQQVQGGKFDSATDTWTPIQSGGGSVQRSSTMNTGTGTLKLTLDKTVETDFMNNRGYWSDVTSTGLEFTAGSACQLNSLTSGTFSGSLSFLRSSPITANLNFSDSPNALGCGIVVAPNFDVQDVNNKGKMEAHEMLNFDLFDQTNKQKIDRLGKPVTWELTDLSRPNIVKLDPATGAVSGLGRDLGSFKLKATWNDKVGTTPTAINVYGLVCAAGNTYYGQEFLCKFRDQNNQMYTSLTYQIRNTTSSYWNNGDLFSFSKTYSGGGTASGEFINYYSNWGKYPTGLYAATLNAPDGSPFTDTMSVTAIGPQMTAPGPVQTALQGSDVRLSWGIPAAAVSTRIQLMTDSGVVVETRVVPASTKTITIINPADSFKVALTAFDVDLLDPDPDMPDQLRVEKSIWYCYREILNSAPGYRFTCHLDNGENPPNPE